jgi:RNA polymerase sigma-70 factor (ECF subfamily)
VNVEGVREALARARAAWPALPLDPARFEAWLERKQADVPGELHVEDLYLACACAAAVPEALAAFDAQVLALVPRMVARFPGGPAFADEVVQGLRARLLVGTPPRIAEYSGRGALRSWVKVAALRLAVDLVRARGELPPDDPGAVDALATAPSPELELLKARYKGAFEQALRDAILGLSVRQRNLLRLHHVDGATLDQLAVSYRVHRATIARWLADGREAVVAGTHARLGATLSLSRSELESLALLVRSQLELSVRQLLGGG